MYHNWLERTELLVKDEGIRRLREAHVIVAGLGGVGAYAAEQLARAGIGKMTIVDADTVESTNINRQLPALHSTIGKSKVSLMSQRIRDINPSIELNPVEIYLEGDKFSELLDSEPDFVVDAIDTLAPKLDLITESVNRGISLVSSMGAGGKTDPSKVEVCDLADSHSCRLARVVRKYLHRRDIYTGFDVVFSSEMVDDNAIREELGKNKKSTVGTISYMPPVFGCFCASAVLRKIVES